MNIQELRKEFTQSTRAERRSLRIKPNVPLFPEQLEQILLLNVDFISNHRQAPELGCETDDLVQLRCTALVEELIWLGKNLVPSHRLVFADLWLADHAQAGESQTIIWAAASCLDEEDCNRESLGRRFEKYFESEGTRLRERSFISGYSFDGNREKHHTVSKDLRLRDGLSLCVPAHPWERSLGKIEVTGQEPAYLKSVVFAGQPDGSPTQFYLEHLQAGFDASDRIVDIPPELREACTVHLFLTFAPIKNTGKEWTLRELHATIGAQMARISTLFLFEKSRQLRLEIEQARSRERDRNLQLTERVEELLDKLGAVEGIARGLRHSFSSPLDRYKDWIGDWLPLLFEPSTGSLDKLRVEFGSVPTLHEADLWTSAHAIAALWLLCEPPVPLWLGEAARHDLSLADIWRFTITSAEKRDAADPWIFCAAHYASVGDPGHESEIRNLARTLKTIKLMPAAKSETLRLDLRVLQFLACAAISHFETEPAAIQVPVRWHEPVFVGIPRLARIIMSSGQKTVSVEWSGTGPDSHVTLLWPAGGPGVSLIESVETRIGDLISPNLRPTRAKQRTASPNPVSSLSTSQLLEGYRGKNDTTNALARVLLSEESWQESGFPKLSVGRNGCKLMVMCQLTEAGSEVMVSSLSCPEPSPNPADSEGSFRVELYLLS